MMKCVIHSKSDNIKIMMNDKAHEVIRELFDSLKIDIKLIWNQWKVVSFILIMFIYCITNVIQ